jgi:NAD(P)H-nitrite reductase large subunit
LSDKDAVNAIFVADTVDMRLHDMMKAVVHKADGTQDLLAEAVEQKGTFESDDTALNKTICRCFDQCHIAALIGPLDQDFSGDEQE